MKLTRDVSAQIADVYKRMADEARYRPGAPSDGFGNITGPLDMAREQDTYATQWWADEENMTFFLGCPSYELRKTMILCVEAARACASAQQELARKLIELALSEAEQ